MNLDEVHPAHLGERRRLVQEVLDTVWLERDCPVAAAWVSAAAPLSPARGALRDACTERRQGDEWTERRTRAAARSGRGGALVEVVKRSFPVLVHKLFIPCAVPRSRESGQLIPTLRQ
jgi:hypothetical protein